MSGDGIEGLHDPPTGELDTAAIAAAGDEQPPRERRGASRFMGHGAADQFSRRVGATDWVTPMVSGAADDGAYLRAVLGNVYFALPILGFVLGLIAGISTSGLAVPPSLLVTCIIIVLGVFDAFSGLVALGAFTLVVLFSGNLFGSHMFTASPGEQSFIYTVTGLFGLGVLFYAGGLLARRLRPLRVVRGGAGVSLWARRIVDYAAIPIIGTIVIWFVAWQMPTLAGNAPQELFVNIQDHLLVVKVVAFFALAARALLYAAVLHNFEARSKVAMRDERRSRHALLHVVFWLIRGLVGLLVLRLYVGFGWMMWVALGLLLLISPAAWLGRRLPQKTVSKLAYPLVILRILVVIVLTELVLTELTHHVVNPTPMLGGILIAAGVLFVLWAFLDHAVVVGKRRDLKTAIADGIALALLVLLIDGVLAIGASPFVAPRGVYVTPTGAVFVADTGNNRVVLIWKGGFRETVGVGLSRPADVAGDGDPKGFVYIADAGNNTVWRIRGYYKYTVGSHTFNLALAAGAGAQTSIGSGLNSPQSVSVNGLGDVFVADTGNGRIVEISRKTWKQTTFLKGLDHPLAVLCDPFPFYTASVFVADTGNGSLLEVLPNHHVIRLLAGLDKPAGLAEDPWGNLYVSEMGSGKVLEIPDHGLGTPYVIDSGLDHPRGLSVDALGDLFISDSNAGQVKVIATLREHVLVTHGVPDPSAVAVAPYGAVYVTDATQGLLQEWDNGSLSTVASGLTDPIGAAATPSGDVWVDLKGGQLVLVDPATGRWRVVASGLAEPRQLWAAPNASGGVLVAEEGAGAIVQYEKNGASRTLLSGLKRPVAVAEDYGGDVVVGLVNGNVEEFARSVKKGRHLFNLRGITAIAMDAAGNSYTASSRYRLIVMHVAATGVDAVISRDYRSLSGLSATARGVLWVVDRKSIGLYYVRPTGFYTQL